MARQSYTINGYTFATKADLEVQVKHILHRYRPPSRLSYDDEAFIGDLLQRHPSAERKIGCGIAEIWVRRTMHNAQGFIIRRVDGTEEDFSYKQCIRETTYATKVKFAFRRAIVDQVLAVKQAVLPDHITRIACPVTGEPISWNEAHVDHEPPYTFAALVEDYLQSRGVTFDDISLIEPSNGIGKILPREWALDWSEWHRQHARLRVISAYANLRLVR